MMVVFFFSFLPFLSGAQPAPVGAEFSGPWFFDRAEAQERPMDSKQNYMKRTVSQDEFWQKSYFLNMPTEVLFDGFFAQISHPSWSSNVVSVINNGMLEFYNAPEGETPSSHNMDLYTVMAPAYSLTLNGNLMSMQCNYVYLDAQGKNMEGILTIYYKR
jgi:hypothetical protein